MLRSWHAQAHLTLLTLSVGCTQRLAAAVGLEAARLQAAFPCLSILLQALPLAQ